MECTYVPLHISKKCLDAMWYLTLNKNEWGGQLIPKQKQGQCQLDCSNIKLVKGTGLNYHTDEKFYTGNDNSRAVQIAVTPLYQEVFQKYPLCKTAHCVNMFFHTHPLLLTRDMPAHDHTAQFSPPSAGDIFAHTVLSNYRNWKENNQINTPIVMAFEGMYMYTIMPIKFCAVVHHIESLLAEKKLSAAEQKDAAIGELPQHVIDIIKQEIFDELRPVCEKGATEQEHFIDNCRQEDKNSFDIQAAQESNSKFWSCGTSDTQQCPTLPSLQFPFYETIQQDHVRQFLQKDNKLLKGLQAHGFHYDFYPAPFPEHGVTLMVPTTMVFK